MAEKYISPDARRKAASNGQALPGGSYPIRNEDELRRAIKAVGRAGDKSAQAVVRRFIKRRAAALGLTKLIPEQW